MLILTLTTSCATTRGRFLLGAGAGAAAGGGAGAIFSPNSESRGLNVLVFGLLGALAGGAIGAFLFKDPKPSVEPKQSIKEIELETTAPESKLYVAPTSSKLPSYVKERLHPVIIEEFVEPDTVSDDGSLHTPHKVYRIQRQAELYSKPGKPQSQEEKAQ